MKKHFNRSGGRLHAIGIMATLLIGLSAGVFYAGCAYADDGDNFDDGIRQFRKWPFGYRGHSGMLNETNGRLEYTTRANVTSDDTASWHWGATRLPYRSDWDIQINVHNDITLANNTQVTSFGIEVYNLRLPYRDIYAELYCSHAGSAPQRNGFHAANEEEVFADTGMLPVVDGAVRISFNSTDKVITVYYDTDTADGYQWVEYGSFGIAGTGGTTATADWGLHENARLGVLVYGYSANTAVAASEMYGDNFSETGGRGLCPIAHTLGEDDPATERLRTFRDESLAASACGRRLIQLYYMHADSIRSALESSPLLHAAVRLVLKAVAESLQ